MSASRLTIVSPTTGRDQVAETTAERIKRLQSEAYGLARQEVSQFERQIGELASFAREIAAGGEAYPVGARELARRLAEDLPRQAGVLEALLRRY